MKLSRFTAEGGHRNDPDRSVILDQYKHRVATERPEVDGNKGEASRDKKESRWEDREVMCKKR